MLELYEVHAMEKKQQIKKSTQRSDAEKRKLVNRLNRIEGQINGVRKMILEDRSAPDILIQSSAATSALKSFSKEILSEYLKNNVSTDIRNNNTESLDDLIKSIQSII